MRNLVHVVQKDERPDLIMQITDVNTGKPVDLTHPATTVVCRFRKKGTTKVLFTQTAEMVDAFEGTVSMSWPTDALDIDPGLYELQVTINFEGVEEQTVPYPVNIKVWERFDAST
ncbi:MAG: hypothetical protein DRH04_06120 [Deltaproteobacteria bacterium]|nr:MAG: hypothetical protein DRH04_06120 [Deltaproteobacteria bacterium]